MAIVSPVTFLKEVRTELAKVTWPTRKEAIRLTMVVIGVSVAVGLFIGILDITFIKLADFILKLK